MSVTLEMARWLSISVCGILLSYVCWQLSKRLMDLGDLVDRVQRIARQADSRLGELESRVSLMQGRVGSETDVLFKYIELADMQHKAVTEAKEQLGRATATASHLLSANAQQVKTINELRAKVDELTRSQIKPMKTQA